MVDTVASSSSTSDVIINDVDFSVSRKHAMEDFTENVDEHSTKKFKPRRKFHQLECECVECVERYGATVVPPEKPRSADEIAVDPAFRETTAPYAPCLCYQCEDEAFYLYPDKLDKRVHVFLRRTNNCTCTCGICRNCVSDPMYFKIISDHIDRVRTCECMFCENYRNTHQRFGWTL